MLVFAQFSIVLAALAGPMAGAPADPRVASPTCAVLVSTSGSDMSTCGRSPNTPCRTINFGIARAITDGLSCVFVRAGIYNEVVVLQGNVDVIGGYDLQWAPGPYTDPAHRVQINGALDGATGEYLTVRAHNLPGPARMAQMILQGPNATGTSGLNGRSAYVVHVKASNLTLENVQVIAGNGANGINGSNGTNASLSMAQSGGAGGPGDEFVTACNSSSRGAGGGGGANPSCSFANGGGGGFGGFMDTDCSFPPDFDALPGTSGSYAATNGPGYGAPGSGAGVCAGGGAGQNGRHVNGVGGARNSAGTINASGFWYGNAGGSGTLGDNGSGGGGGGGAGGCDAGTDSYGAGGGGGGAGGCRAPGAGGGGGGGGGSFGVMAVSFSTVTATSCQFVRGNGGNGGAGGAGGQGQPGGLGGVGGPGPGGGPGGNGGKGGHGGHGGGGAGGFGGRSAGILYTPGTSIIQSSTFISGSAGSGGPGGISAPGAPPLDDDGSDGQTGQAGTHSSVYAAVNATIGAPERAGEEGAMPGDGGEIIENSDLQPASAPAPMTPAAVCDVDCATLDAPVADGTGPLAFAPIVPSPARDRSQVKFTLPTATTVKIEVFDAGGRTVRVLENSFRGPGTHTVMWDGRNGEGQRVPVGFYVVRLQALGRTLSRNVTVVR
jgi:hypothetical protein